MDISPLEQMDWGGKNGHELEVSPHIASLRDRSIRMA